MVVPKYSSWRRAALPALAALTLALCYASTLRGMALQWWNDDDMGHGFVVPVAAAWIVWRGRMQWRDLPLTPSGWGFAVLFSGALLHLAGSLGGGLFANSVAFLISLAGVVVCLGGFPLLRAWSFPLLLLLFMLPKLAIVYNQATLPLQLLASKLAAGMLTFTGAAVIRDGNVLDVGGHRVAVEEACNGIRYLLPLGFVSAVFAYLADPRPWMRVALLAVTIPVAIAANALRVAIAAGVPFFDAGTPHEVAGLVIFLLSMAAIVPIPRLCRTLAPIHHV